MIPSLTRFQGCAKPRPDLHFRKKLERSGIEMHPKDTKKALKERLTDRVEGDPGRKPRTPLPSPQDKSKGLNQLNQVHHDSASQTDQTSHLETNVYNFVQALLRDPTGIVHDLQVRTGYLESMVLDLRF